MFPTSITIQSSRQIGRRPAGSFLPSYAVIIPPKKSFIEIKEHDILYCYYFLSWYVCVHFVAVYIYINVLWPSCIYKLCGSLYNRVKRRFIRSPSTLSPTATGFTKTNQTHKKCSFTNATTTYPLLSHLVMLYRVSFRSSDALISDIFSCI
jgi:hypothetical protein